MATLLEITDDDIAQLNDADLRSLIGMLCEADYRSAGLSTAGIIWGGHQDAGDGGLDVAVNHDVDPPSSGFIPNRITGFQVKKSDMPPSKIVAEMRPNGKLRESIKELIHKRGAYIIVSSSGSTADSALKRRVTAMHDAVAGEPDGDQLDLDFLDRGRIATWVRNHPSMILWVNDKLGRTLRGWKPYGNWANAPAGVQEEYIVDEKLRLYDEKNTGIADSILDGMHKLRVRLSREGASIRLIGLSGVGKTRLVQALFDDRVGENALNRYLVHYTDISFRPDPDPVSFAGQLVAAGTKAFLVVDNCSQKLHRQLARICSKSSSTFMATRDPKTEQNREPYGSR